jgi:hypothetical protein
MNAVVASPQPPVSNAPWLTPEQNNLEHLLCGETKKVVFEITQEIFPGAVALRVDEDPEHAGYRYAVIETRAVGEIAEIVAKETEWHRRIIRHDPRLAALRLSVDVQ